MSVVKFVNLKQASNNFCPAFLTSNPVTLWSCHPISPYAHSRTLNWSRVNPENPRPQGVYLWRRADSWERYRIQPCWRSHWQTNPSQGSRTQGLPSFITRFVLLQINFFTLLATTKAMLTEVMMTKRMISTLKKMMLKLLQLFKILG